MGSMEQRQRVFERFGKTWRPPQACKAGSFGVEARWRMIRDGLRECIEFLPLSERGLETKLQDAWMMAAKMVADVEEKSGGEWLIPS